MRAWELQGGFGLDNLRLVERDPPRPGPGELRLRLRAAALNYRDLLMIAGLYNPRQPLPLVPCSDAVGEVVELGLGVERFAVGDRVCPIFTQGWLSGLPRKSALGTTLGGPLPGTLQQELVLPAEAAVAAPAHLTDAEAACLPCAGVTAWRALEDAGIGAGDTVLTLGTGGVSLFALQLARLRGARVAITSSSDEKLKRAAALGAALGVNYREETDWGRIVSRWSGGEGVDCVVEVGGAGTLRQSLSAVRPGGTIALIGVLAGVSTELPLTRILMRGVRVQGVIVGNRQDFEGLNRALCAHPQLRPVVDKVFPFGEAAAALSALGEARHLGKLVVALD